MTILFPHVPKTGGTSLLKSLSAAYGDKLLLDYHHNSYRGKFKLAVDSALIAFRKKELTNNYKVIFGHFDPRVYNKLGLTRALFFRDPEDRAVSHYQYLLKRKKIPLEFSMSDFVKQPRIQNLYSFYCNGVSIEDLAFVGITERYTESLCLFNKIFGVELTEHRERINYTKPVEKTEIGVCQSINQEIYERALKRFDFLIKKHGLDNAF